MNRRSFPQGQANGSLLKALRRVIVDLKGHAVADSWLRGIEMSAVDIEDETRMLPLETRHRALMAFTKVCSVEALSRLPRALVSSECIGAWVRILRNAATVDEAFSQIGSMDGDASVTVRWETVAHGRGRWRGRISIAHDPSLEADGLLDLARVAELSAIPTLFGWPGVKARSLGRSGATFQREYAVRWQVPNPWWSAGIGGVAGGALGAMFVVARFGISGVDLATTLGLVALGAGLGILRMRDRVRRAETEAHVMRLRALERSLTLRESRESESIGHMDGLLAAGQYRIVRQMGAGATGVIYEAVRVVDNLPIALKLLRAVAAHDAVASDRLRRESEALRLSWHPNVVEVLDEGYLPDGTAYLAMELLRGETLAARLRAHRCLTPEEILPIAIEVCDALSAVHAAGVVHRDIKPSNIYLVSDRSHPELPAHAKILDFGIARVEWEETRITHSGGPLGSPGYMSPEQERGSADVDGRSDLFSLGAVLYECLVGDPPPPLLPSGLIRMASGVSSTARSSEPFAHKAMSLVPGAFRPIIEKAMAFDPAERYEDARSFGVALRSVMEAGAQISS